MTISIKVEGDTALVAKCTSGLYKDLAKKAVERLLDIASDELDSQTPRRTGRLIGSKRRESGEQSGKIMLTAPHAGIIERGTKAHLIRPREKKVLWFEGHAAMRVSHPGTTGRHMLQKAKEKADSALPQVLESVANEVENRWGG